MQLGFTRIARRCMWDVITGDLKIKPPCGNENSKKTGDNLCRGGQHAVQESSGTSSKAPTDSSCSPPECAQSAAEDASASFSFAVVLAEALSTARQNSGEDVSVAIGNIEGVLPHGVLLPHPLTHSSPTTTASLPSHLHITVSNKVAAIRYF